MKEYLIEWLDQAVVVKAESAGKAKYKAMLAAREAGYWKPGKSLKGLRCRLLY